MIVTGLRWLSGRAMVLGSFQCRGVLLLWHMVGQGPDVLAAGAGRVRCFFCCCCCCFFLLLLFYFCFLLLFFFVCCFVVVVYFCFFFCFFLFFVVVVFFVFFSSRLSYLPFLMPHLLGDGWTY